MALVLPEIPWEIKMKFMLQTLVIGSLIVNCNAKNFNNNNFYYDALPLKTQLPAHHAGLSTHNRVISIVKPNDLQIQTKQIVENTLNLQGDDFVNFFNNTPQLSSLNLTWQIVFETALLRFLTKDLNKKLDLIKENVDKQLAEANMSMDDADVDIFILKIVTQSILKGLGEFFIHKNNPWAQNLFLGDFFISVACFLCRNIKNRQNNNDFVEKRDYRIAIDGEWYNLVVDLMQAYAEDFGFKMADVETAPVGEEKLNLIASVVEFLDVLQLKNRKIDSLYYQSLQKVCSAHKLDESFYNTTYTFITPTGYTLNPDRDYKWVFKNNIANGDSLTNYSVTKTQMGLVTLWQITPQVEVHKNLNLTTPNTTLSAGDTPKLNNKMVDDYLRSILLPQLVKLKALGGHLNFKEQTKKMDKTIANIQAKGLATIIVEKFYNKYESLKFRALNAHKYISFDLQTEKRTDFDAWVRFCIPDGDFNKITQILLQRITREEKIKQISGALLKTEAISLDLVV